MPPTSSRASPTRGRRRPTRSASYTLLNHESPEFIRFVNPGDLRVAHISCGTASCHGTQVRQVRKSMMTHGCMFWGAALYNNGSVPFKRGPLRRELQHERRAAAAPDRARRRPRTRSARRASCRSSIRCRASRSRSRATSCASSSAAASFDPETGIPNTDRRPRPAVLARLSVRGLGTENRTDPVFLGLQKTRLFDPTLNFLGTNDHPGDYRSSGCTACHVIYANDRSPDQLRPLREVRPPRPELLRPTRPFRKDEPGHPIDHKFATGNASRPASASSATSTPARTS